MDEPFISPPEAASIAGITTGHLAQMRFTGRGPKYYKPSPKRVLYKASEVRSWIEASARTSTADPAHA
jgi:predicted DNA-binding transcriptional regulator AlpA